MATATKRRPPKAATNGNGNGHPVTEPICDDCGWPAPLSSPGVGPAEETRRVRITLVEARADNPRSDWADDEDFRQLVESIRRHGVLEPILVREKPGYHGDRAPRVGGRELPLYEIAAGERRYRAAKVAGLAEIPVSIRRMTDQELREIRYHENATRKDLSPIDQAREFQAMLDAGDAPGPTELAKRLGVSQGFVSSRLALLKLPEKWQRRIISREMPPTHARCLAPYADQPSILTHIDQQTTGGESLKEFENGVRRAAMRATKPMSGKEYFSKQCLEVPIFKPTDAERAQLGIVEVLNWSGKKEQRASNVKMWQKLQEAHAKEWVKKHAERGKKQAAKVPQKKLTPAEQERKAKEAKEKHVRALGDFVRRWILELVPAAIRQRGGIRLGLILGLGGSISQWVDPFRDVDRLTELLKANGIKVEKSMGRWRQEAKVLEALDELPNDQKLCEVVTEVFASAFEHIEFLDVSGGEVLQLASVLGIDLEEAWKTEQRDDRGRAFYELHSKEELLELAKEFHVEPAPGMSKEDLIRVFQEAKKPLPFPKSLKKARVA